jgi:hypothetical protein
MGLEQEGIIYRIDDAQTIGDNFTKREFVVEVENTQYGKRYASFQLTGNKCDLIDPYAVGETVTVKFNIGVKPFVKDGVEKFYNNLNAWGITRIGEKKTGASKVEAAVAQADEEEDLPF